MFSIRTNDSQAYTIFPQSFKDIVDLLVPELRARGLIWSDYAKPGGTYRENFYGQPGQTGPPEGHPAAKYRWRAGVASEESPVPA